MGYTWAECESYFFDANLAVEFWEAAQVVAAPESLLSPALFLSSWAPSHSNRCTTFSVDPTIDADDPCAGPKISLAQGARVTQATGMVWHN